MPARTFGKPTGTAVHNARQSDAPVQLWVFPTALGFMALVEQEAPDQQGVTVRQLTIAHPSPTAALRAIEPTWWAQAAVQDEPNWLVERLQAYAEGDSVDFDDVRVAPDSTSLFRRRVLAACRAIPRGETRTYGELALAAGAPRAARAVGTAMSSNRVAIIVPCHRVVRCGGHLGGYSAPAGLAVKRRLLELERVQVSDLVPA